MTQLTHPLRSARSARSAGRRLPFEPASRRATRRLKLGLGFSSLAGLADACLIVALALASGALYHIAAYDELGVVANYARVGALVALFYVATQALQGRYGVQALAASRLPVARILLVWNAAFFALLASAFLAKASGVYSRGAVILFYFAGLAGVTLLRAGLGQAVASGFAAGRLMSRRALLVGDAHEVAAFPARLAPETHGLLVAGAVALPRTGAACAKGGHEAGRFEAALARAVEEARRLKVDEVFLLVPWGESETLAACADAFLTTPAAINLGPARVLERYRDIHLWRIGNAAGLALARPPLSALEQAGKRALDLVCATLGLALLSPLFAAIAVAIKLESRGPVFFRQRRAGFNQETFRILKFRTMRCTEDGPKIRQAKASDPRITPLGRFLRRWNLDELPQLWNVLKGEMSIVGPRPHALAHHTEFERRVARYARRHNVKPGITGWAQVNGHRGPTDTEAKIRARVEHDLYYIDNWSLLFDIQIMALTVFSARAFANAH